MGTLTAQDLVGQLERAQREAGELGTELARLMGEQEQAAEAKDYGRAAELKRQADELRPRAMLAESQARAIRQTLDGLREHAEQEGAAQAEKERQERAQEARAVAAAGEKAAIAESERLLAQAKEQMKAARETLRQALAAEATAGQYRQEAYQVAVDAGWQEPSMYGPAGPNPVRAAIDARPLLRAVLQATD